MGTTERVLSEQVFEERQGGKKKHCWRQRSVDHKETLTLFGGGIFTGNRVVVIVRCFCVGAFACFVSRVYPGSLCDALFGFFGWFFGDCFFL